MSPDGQRVASASYDKTVRSWDRNGKTVAVLKFGEEFAFRASFSPKGDLVVTSSGEGTVKMWTAEGKFVRSLEAEGFWSGCRAWFNREEDRILCTGDRVVVWDLEGREIASFGGEEGGVTAALSPDGKLVLVRSARTSRIFSIDGKHVAELTGQAFGGFAPSGQSVLTWAADEAVRLFDLAGRELVVLRGHERPITDASFSPSGDRVVTASQDGTARVWLVKTEELLGLAKRRTFRELTPGERKRYRALLESGAEVENE